MPRSLKVLYNLHAIKYKENNQKYLHAYQNAYVKKEKKIGIQSTISLHPRESIGMLSDLGSMLTITKAIHNSCGFVYPI